MAREKKQDSLNVDYSSILLLSAGWLKTKYIHSSTAFFLLQLRTVPTIVISRYSDFLLLVLINTGIFLHGSKLCGESRT